MSGPNDSPQLTVAGIGVVIFCDDGAGRLVNLTDARKAAKLVEFIRHNICGGNLQLKKEPVEIRNVFGGEAIKPE